MEKIVQYVKGGMIFFLLLGMLDIPEAFFSFIHLLAMGAFIWIAYYEYLYYRELRMIVYGGLSILYQPFITWGIPVDYWVIINLLTATWLAYSIYLDKKKPRTKRRNKGNNKKKKH